MKKLEISIFVFPDGKKIISQFERISGDIGDPDLRLVEPFVLEYNGGNTTALLVENTHNRFSEDQYVLKPWLIQFTNDNDFLIHSDKIFVSIDPTSLLISLYETAIK
jgi:hypothetical protein